MTKYGILLATLAMALSASAQMLVGWDVKGVELDDGTYSNGFSLAAHTTALHVVSATLTLPETVNESLTSDQYGFKIDTADEQTSLAGALASGHYLQFEIVLEDGYVMRLASLEMKGESTGAGCGDVAVLSNVGGFSTNGVIAAVSGIQGKTGGFDTDESGFGGPIDLTGEGHQGISSVTFRIYGWNSSNPLGVTRIRNLAGYDLILNGVVEFVKPTPTLMVIQ